MNVRKRGLALLMCICMIFTLLPFSAFADGTSEPDVVYGSYDGNGKWTQVDNAGDTVTKTVDNQGNTVTLKKTATPTETENQYKIDLQVFTTETSTTKAGDAAAVLVIDVSGSMAFCAECGNEWEYHFMAGHDFVSRISSAKKAAIQFLDAFKSDGATRLVSVVKFASGSDVVIDWRNISEAGGYNEVKNAIDRLGADGGTNLDAALQTADAQLSNNAVKNFASKNVVALTDGIPTFYGTKGVSQHGTYGCPDTNAATAKSAAALRNSANVYTVCFGAANDKCWDKNSAHGRRDVHSEDGPTVGNFLKDSIATPASNGKTYAYNANSTTELLNAFKSITDTITDGISAGTVTDGLPGNVSFVGEIPAEFENNSDGTYGWKLIPENAVKGEDNGKTTYTYNVSYVVELDTTGSDFDESVYHPLNTATTFTSGEHTYDFNVPGVKGKAPRYTVTYNKGEHGTLAGQDSDGNVINRDVRLNSTTPAAPEVTAEDGYEFTGWAPAVAEKVTGDATYVAQYKIKDDLGYTVNYYWNGTQDKVADSKTVSDLTFGTVVTETPVDVDGYTPVSEEAVELKVSTGANVINFYYYKNVQLTANSKTDIIYDSKEHSVSGFTGAPEDADFSAITVGAKGTAVGEYEAKFAEGTIGTVDASKKYIVVEAADGLLVINPIDTEVVVTITGNPGKEVYTGLDTAVNGFTTDVGDKAINVALKDGVKAEATGTDVGTYKMGLSKEDFDVTSDIYSNISVVVIDGYLEITPRPLYLKADTPKPITYDGTEHVGSLVVVMDDGKYLDIVSTQMLENVLTMYRVSGTNVGTYKGEFLQLAKIVSRSDPSKDVTANYDIKYETGTLQITKMPITITAGSAEGAYILGPITSNEWKATATAEGDTVSSVKITGSQTTLGESPNVASDAVIKNAKGEDVTANYEITYVDGLLKGIELLEKEIHFNYIIGYTDGTVRPDADVTRAEVATIFFRLLTDEAREMYSMTTCGFSDVNDGQWYTRAIATLTNAGILKGYPNGTFNPNAPITRAEMATVIARFAKLDVNTKTFSDIDGHWAKDYIELAAGNGWINGYDDGTFRPNNNITRAETVAMINRVLDRLTENVSDLLPADQMTTWTDNMDTTQWFYKDIQEATNYHKCDRVDQSTYEKWTEKVPDIDWATYQI